MPKDFFTWSAANQEAFIEKEWHLRKNGYWALICGEPYFIPGRHHTYCSWWTEEWGSKPMFRFEGLELFWIIDMAIRDPNCFGLIDIKGRRAGDTGKLIFTETEICTRYRNARGGNMHMTDDDAEKNFQRIITGMRDMPFFFKPQSLSGDKPKAMVEWDFAGESRSVTRDKQIERQEKVLREAAEKAGVMPLRSWINYESTVLSAYDGQRLTAFVGDEMGKTSVKKMDWRKQWPIIKPMLSLNNERYIIGKGFFPTTVEAIENADTVAVCNYFWDNSDPREVNAVGRTKTGLWRVFRDFFRGAEVDKYGRVDRDKELAWWEAQVESAKSLGEGELSDFMRKFPRYIHHALNIPAAVCQMLPEVIDAQRERLVKWINDPEFQPFMPVRGDLVWEQGFGGNVRFIPNPNGHFRISQFPETPNSRVFRGGKFCPANDHVSSLGVDGIDHSGDMAQRSRGAGAIFRAFNPAIDGDLELDDNGQIKEKWRMKTGRFIMTYAFRPANPHTFYEHMLMASIFWGIKMFAERAKPGVIHYFEQHGFSQYLGWKPAVIKVGPKKETSPGLPAAPGHIDLWVGGLKAHLADFSETYVHDDLLGDMRKFDGKNRGELDLFVAAGHARLHAEATEIQQRREAKRKNRYEYGLPI